MILNKKTSIFIMLLDLLRCIFLNKKPNISSFEIDDKVLLSNSLTTIRWATNTSFAVSISSGKKRLGIFNKRGSLIIPTNELSDHLQLKSFGIREVTVATVPVRVLDVKKQIDLNKKMIKTPEISMVTLKPLLLIHHPVLSIPLIQRINIAIRCELPKIKIFIPERNINK